MARALWQQPGDGSGAGTPPALQQAGGDQFGPELPGAARTVRFVFTPSSGEACCVAVDPRTIPVDSALQQRVLVLTQLPVGSGSLTVAAFPTDFAPAVGESTTCTTNPASAGKACDSTRGQTPSFSSDPQPVNIRLGINTDAGDILVRSLPFVVPGSLIPASDEQVANPVAAGFTVADAVHEIDSSSIRLQLVSNGAVAAPQPLQLEPCDDAGETPCSVDVDLDVRGVKVAMPAQEVAPGSAESRIEAANTATPPHSVALTYGFTVLAAPRTATVSPTARPTETVGPTETVRPPVTRTPTTAPTAAVATRTATAVASRTVTATRRATSTPVRSPTRTPTTGPAPSPTIVFVGVQSIIVSARPDFLASADFNRDGNADLVVMSPLSTEMNVLLGSSNSPSQFGEVTVLRFGDRLREPVVGDPNDDGNLDIIVPDVGAAGVWIALGNGDGTFRQPSLLPVGNLPYAVAVADFDDRPGDDLAVADRQRNSVVFRLSNGTDPLEFSVGPELFSGSNPEEIIAIDLNGDDHADLATLNIGLEPTLGVLVWRQVGGDGLPVFESVVSYEAGDRPEGLVQADLDGDGDPDLVLLNRPSAESRSEIAPYLSSGDGALDPLSRVVVQCPSGETGACPARGLTAGDFEQDGDVDLAVALVDPRALPGGDAVRVLEGRGNGSFLSGPTFPVGDEVTAIVAGDYSGDGPVDLAVSSSVNTSAQVLVNVSVLASGGN